MKSRSKQVATINNFSHGFSTYSEYHYYKAYLGGLHTDPGDLVMCLILATCNIVNESQVGIHTL